MQLNYYTPIGVYTPIGTFLQPDYMEFTLDTVILLFIRL